MFMYLKQEILRLEKTLSDVQEKLNESENNRERLEKELESMSDLSHRVTEDFGSLFSLRFINFWLLISVYWFLFSWLKSRSNSF